MFGGTKGGDPQEGPLNLKEAVRRLFVGGGGNSLRRKVEKCDVCFGGGGGGEEVVVAPLSGALREEVVGVVLKALLVPQGEEEGRQKKLWLCEECKTSLTSLTDLFLQLEELRWEFNDLRRRVGRQVILGSLGESEEAWEGWEEEVRGVEDLFPSCVGRKERSGVGMREMGVVKRELEEEERMSCGGSVCDFVVAESVDEGESEVEDFKLKKMTPVVVLERLKEANAPKLKRKVTFKEEKNSDVDNFDEMAESVEVNCLLEEENESTSTEEPLRRNLRKRRHVDFSDSMAEEFDGEEDDFLPSDDEDEDLYSGEEDVFKTPGNKNSSHKCPRCDKTFSRSDHVLRHIRNFHDNPKPPKKPKVSTSRRPRRPEVSTERTPCPYCDSTFSRNRDARRHILLTHKIDVPAPRELKRQRPYQCMSCEKSYAKSAHLTRHCKETHPSSALQCPSCPEQFWREKPLLDHRKLAHDFKPPSTERKTRFCSVCSRVFSHRRDLRRHERSVHSILPPNGSELQCTHCDLKFFDPLTYKRHRLRRHFLGSKEAGRGAQCPYCLKFFDQPRTVRKHVKLVHDWPPAEGDGGEGHAGHSPRNIRCYLCYEKDSPQSSLTSAEELRSHEESDGHLEKVRLATSVHCNVCRENFKGNVEALQAHLTGEEHRKEVDSLGNFDETTFCVPCRKNFSTEKELFRHHTSKAHGRDTLFRKMESFSAMIKPVGLEGPLKCSACAEVFDLPRALHRHVALFHDPAGYKCKLCEASFAHLTDLHRHKVSHADEIRKDEICDKCGKAFEFRKNLNRHLKLAHDGERVDCSLCGKSFPSALSLERHVKLVHVAGGGRGLWSCRHCAKAFKKPLSLRQHLCESHAQEHLRETPHPCAVCFHAFPSVGELEEHFKAHAHLKCRSCGRQCLNRTHLAIHSRTHRAKAKDSLREDAVGESVVGNYGQESSAGGGGDRGMSSN